MKPKNNTYQSLGLIALAFAGISTPLAHAASDTWVGTTDATWATSTNWLGGNVPATGDTATFNGAGNANTTINLGGGVTLGSILFDTPSAAAYTIGSGAVGSQTLTLSTVGNALTVNSTIANNQLINANLALAVTRTVATPSTYYAATNNSATNTLTLAGGISASSAGVKVLNVAGTGNTTISGAITSGTGNMSLFKTGSGTLTLSGGGTFSGTGIRDGAAFDSSAVFREGTTILNGGTYSNSGGEPVIGGVDTHGGAGTNTTLQLDNATFNNISWLSVGRGNGNGTVTSNLTLNGSSSITSTNLSAGFNAGNVANIPKGTITLNGTSILESTTTVNFAESAGAEFTMNINNTATFKQTTTGSGQTKVGLNSGAIGVVNVNGGTATFERDFILGAGGTGSGKLVLASGTVNVALGTERWLKLNDSNSASTGRIDVNGGNLNLNTNTDLRFSTNATASGTNVVNLNAGAITGYTGNNNGVFSGTSLVDLNQASNQAGVNNTFNLNGGTLTIGQIITSNNSGTAAFNFNGGTLRAAAASTAFLELGGGNQTANVLTGGAIINSNGFDVTIPQALVSPGADGGLTKLGAGTLTLSGTSSYTGLTTVSAGMLKVTGNISTSALSLGAATLSGNGTAGSVSVNNSAAVISNGNANTNTLTLDALAFTTTGTANLNLTDSNAPLAVTNSLNIGAGFTVNVTTAPTWNNGQTYDLIGYGSLAGSTANITKGTILGLGARQFASIGNSGSAITLAISGDTPVWTGAQSSAWTTAVIDGAKNWKLQNAGTSTDFLTNDQVLFDDTATGTTDINISTANVQVASVVFNNSGVANSGLDYTISSTGGFGIANGSGPANFVKNGDGTVTLKTINSYTGVTSINAGTLQLGDGTTDGDIASSSAIANEGTLVFNRVGSFTYGNVISGYGNVVKNGAGTQILTGDSTLFGSTTINAGTLQIGNGGTTGSLGTSPVTNDASLVFNRSNAFTVSGAIDGTGSVSQIGTGAVTVSAFNSYSGGTSISPGTTVLVNGNRALGTGLVTLANGAVLGAGPAGGVLPNAIVVPAGTTSTLATTGGGNLTLNGNLSGSGNINRTATGGALSVFLSGDNSGFTGTFTVENNANAATRFTTATAGSANAKWVINQPTSTRASVDSPGNTIHFGSLTGTGIVTAQGVGTTTIEVGNLGLNESFTGVLNQLASGSLLAVTKVGAGTWTLTGTNTYTGDTTVAAGVLAVDGDAIANAGKLVINGGKVAVTAAATEVVNTLFLGGTQQASGTYGPVGSAATNQNDTYFVTGSGIVSVTTGPSAGYSTWADLYAPGQTMDMDHDNDGVKNGIEYFMGQTNSTFTANPAAVGGTVTWPMGATYTGVYGTDYEVQSSTDLVIWTQVPPGTGDNTVSVTPATSVVYDMPTGGKSFVRLVVKN